MRTTFEVWAQGDGHIVRRREDKPEEYLIFETQRRWVIWQAALTHGKNAKTAGQKPAASARARAPRAPAISSDEAAVRNQVLNEVLEAFTQMGGSDGMEGIVKVVQSLKKKRKALADQPLDD
jgi:hypothetical protein